MEIITYMGDLIAQHRQAFSPSACPPDEKADFKMEVKEVVEQIHKRTSNYQKMIERKLGIIRVLVRIFTEINA